MAAQAQSSEERSKRGEVKGKPGAMNVVSETTGHGDEPPRMIVALHDSPKDAPDDTVFTDNGGFEHRADAIDAAKLREVLEAVRRGLDQDLEELWETQASQVLRWSEPGSLDEAWAQRFSERFFGINYGGPGQTYFGDGAWDPYIFSRAQPRMRAITTYACWALKKGQWVKQHKGHLRVGRRGRPLRISGRRSFRWAPARPASSVISRRTPILRSRSWEPASTR
jgi:hypothetical protein